MKFQDLLPKEEGISFSKATKKLEELANSFLATVISLNELKSGLVSSEKFDHLLKSLHDSNFEMPVFSAIAAYLAKRVNEKPVNEAYLFEIEDLPVLVDSILKNNTIDSRFVELFFSYAQQDAELLKIQACEIHGKIQKFGASMQRLKHFFEKTPIHIYKGLVSTRNISYNSNWDKMILDLNTKYEKALKKEPEEMIYEMHKSIIQCRIIKRYEDQEKISLTSLLRVFEKMCSALNLDHLVGFYNILRAANLPTNVILTMGECFAERVTSQTIPLGEIEKLVQSIQSNLEINVFSNETTELYFRAESEKVECRNLSVAEIVANLDNFNNSVKKIRECVENNPEYQAHVIERNKTYHGNWNRMIGFLKTDLARESNPEEQKKLEAKIANCNAIMELEKKEGLYSVSKRLYRS